MQLDTSYKEWLEQLKSKIQSAQMKAAIAVNSQLLQLYWDLGKEIVLKQSQAKWGDSVLEQLSIDLRLSFPDISGFSKRNLYAIRQWYLFFFRKYEFVPQPVAQIPWGHNRLIISKIKDVEFYHLHLRCFVVIELKAEKFKPEYAGKLNFYLSAVDSQIKHRTDQPSIGLILCKTKDRIEAEYALRDIQKPIGISEYMLTQALPKELENELPTVEQLENQLSRLDKNED